MMLDYETRDAGRKKSRVPRPKVIGIAVNKE